MADDRQADLEDLYAATLEAGGYERGGVPVPWSSTAYTAEGIPVVSRLPHGYELA